MFTNIKNKLKEKKVDSLLKKILKEEKATFEIRDLESAFENEGEMKEILSEILSMYEYDDEADIYTYALDFISYVDRRNEGYSRQWALWRLRHYNMIETELCRLMERRNQSLDMELIFAARYYNAHSDSDIALQDVKVYANGKCRAISSSAFHNACMKEILLFCKKYRENDSKYLDKVEIDDKWLYLESAYSGCIPSMDELDELPARLKRLDDDDKRDFQERFFQKVWAYLAYIASKKLDLSVVGKNKNVIVLAVLLGMADDKLTDVENAIKYVENILELLEINVPVQEIERLCNAVFKQCRKEVELCREFQRGGGWAVDQLAKLVSIFGIVERTF